MTGKEENFQLQTRVNRLGRHPDRQEGFINGPIYRGSTTLYKKYSDVEGMKTRYFYGTEGNPTVSNLIEAWNALTGAAGSVILPSGLGAITMAFMTVVKAGDTILVSDSVYLPTRTYCRDFLEKMGVNVVYYDPMITADQLRDLLATHPNTSLLFMESPGSQTFEIQDVPSLTAVCREKDICSIIDNTWGTPIFFDALGKGCDISLEAGTKYLGGHSDLLLGLVAANEKWYPKLRKMYDCFSMTPGNEDCFLALRGLRTMHLRLKEAERRGMEMANWLKSRDEVLRIIHPAFPESPGHKFWKRDFTGSAGLFAIIIKPQYTKDKVEKMVDHMSIFGLGYSWGGFESLLMIYDCSTYRTATTFNPGGVLLRIQVGLEDMDDLKRDIADGFERMKC
uniref:Cystathionine beta-lyase n=1 Tax=Herpetomonas muscarum TaxID=5718 RepID=U5KMT4_HERMU|nr:cystathionine beta-lyase [Herpetomonas muscarum]